MSDHGETDAVTGVPDEIEMGGLLLQPGDFVDMYQYERPVGRGGMAYVLLARDPGGHPVALKVLKASRMRTGLARFRREFRALSRLDHPNIIRVESWGDIHGHPYLAMEYVDGQDLHSAIRKMMRRPSEVRYSWVEDVLIQLARALAHLSRRGLVHRDLKPSNVLIDQDGTCKLTDFGIVKDLDPDRDPMVSTTLVGTWAYASPEQIAGDPIDHRSDLYSLGVILYAMLTGRRPFIAENMAGYLEAHRGQAPKPPSELVPDVPPVLERVCLRLLAKSPRDRFQSAAEILDELLLDEPESSVEDAVPASAWVPILVGRQAQIDEAQEALARLTRGQGGVLVIEGGEGHGRSRFLEEVVGRARQLHGYSVYQARISPNEGSFEALLRLARVIGGELGGDVPPELARAIARFAQGRGKMPGDARYQLYDGLRTALDRLLSAGPQVLAIDDLHLAPSPLLDLLGYLVRTVVARDGQPLLVICTSRLDAARDDEPPPAGSFAAFRLGRDLGLIPAVLKLGVLTIEDLKALVGSLIGSGPETAVLARLLSEQTGGDPLFAVEFLRGMVQRGWIEPQAGGGHRLAVPVDELTAGRLAMPPGLRQAIHERLAAVGEDTRQVLEVCAVAANELDVEDLLDVVQLGDEEQSRVEDDPTEMGDRGEPAVAGQPSVRLVRHGPDRWMDAIDQAIEAGLLLERRSALGSRVRFAQGQVGEVVYQDLTSVGRSSLHRRLAAALELRYADSPVAAEAIGEHHRRAGDLGRAWRSLAQAAVGLLERSLHAEASGLLVRAREVEAAAREEIPSTEREPIELALVQVEAELHTNRGEWEAAERSLAELDRRCRQAGRATEADEAVVLLGTTLRRLGRGEEGVERIREVLVRARKRHDRRVELRALHALAGAAWSEGDLDGCERLASQALLGAVGPEMAEGRAGILLALTAVQASKGQLALAVTGLSEAEELLRGLREKKTRASVLCNLSEVLSWKGDLTAAEARAEEARVLASGVVYRVVEASALRCRALARLELGDLSGARADLEQALELVRHMALVEEEVAIRFLMGRLLIKQGELALAERHLEAAHAATAVADPESYGPSIMALLARVLAAQGRRDDARLVLARCAGAAEHLHAPRRTELLLLLAGAWNTLGDRAPARAVARQAVTVAESYEFRTWAMHAHSLVVVLATDDPEIAAARERGSAIARGMLTHLTPDRARAFRSMASVVRLLGAPLV